MAILVRIVQSERGEPLRGPRSGLLAGYEELVASFDSPRVVIGRAAGCDLLLPDPTVSARHASVRQRNAGYVIVDEGSTNGLLVGGAKLAAQTPAPLRDGQIVRVGRTWLEVRTTVGGSLAAPKPDAIARMLVRQQLISAGESVHPTLRVVEGPAEGVSRAVDVEEGEIVVGRSQHADWALADPQLSRRHLAVTLRGADVLVWDLNSKRGSMLDGEPLGTDPTRWRPGQRVEVGQSVLELSDPVPEALAELLASPDERMKSSEFAEPPPASLLPPDDEDDEDGFEQDDGDRTGGDPHVDDGEAGDGSSDPGVGVDADAEALDDAESGGPAAGGRLFEVVVALVALAVLGLSVLGLVWLLRG